MGDWLERLRALVKQTDPVTGCYTVMGEGERADLRSAIAEIERLRALTECLADHARARCANDEGWKDTDSVQIIVSIGALRAALSMEDKSDD